MKQFILTEAQLKEFIDYKKSEKVFYNILEKIYENKKHLNKNISHKKVNQSVINDFLNKKLITSKVNEMLIENKIINENYQII